MPQRKTEQRLLRLLDSLVQRNPAGVDPRALTREFHDALLAIGSRDEDNLRAMRHIDIGRTRELGFVLDAA